MKQNNKTQKEFETNFQESFKKEHQNLGNLPCRSCGAPVPVQNLSCSYCKTAVSKDFAIRAKQIQSTKTSNISPNMYQNGSRSTKAFLYSGKQKKKSTALLLCIFLGFIGAHKFYEDKIVLGFVYFFTGGLFGIGILCDFFTLLMKKNPTYYV